MKETTARALVPGTKLIVKVAEDLLRRNSFDDYADLKDALKTELSRLGIGYDGGLIADALDRLELGGSQPVVRRRVSVRLPPDMLVSEPPVIGRGEAARLLSGLESALKTLPKRASRIIIDGPAPAGEPVDIESQLEDLTTAPKQQRKL